MFLLNTYLNNISLPNIPKVFSRYLGNDVPEKFRPRREILREKLTKRPLSNLHGFDKKKFCCDLILFSKKYGPDE